MFAQLTFAREPLTEMLHAAGGGSSSSMLSKTFLAGTERTAVARRLIKVFDGLRQAGKENLVYNGVRFGE